MNLIGVMLLALRTMMGQVAPSDPDAQLKLALARIEQLANKVAAQEARIEELKANEREASRSQSATAKGETRIIPAVYSPAAPPVALAAAEAAAPEMPMPMPADAATPAQSLAETPPPQPDTSLAADPHDHMINLPGGGPTLKIRGFFDFNYGMGSVANPLIFPLAGHDTFQAGEFDLFLSSKLSNHLSFIAEMIFGSDQTNLFGIDIER